jgi:large subunit ribosomal protein L6
LPTYSKMKKQIDRIIEIPEGHIIELHNKIIIIKKGSEEIKIIYKISDMKIKLEGNKLIIEKAESNKTDKKLINSLVSHIKNAIQGMDKKYEYKLQICSIHFPMNVKVEKNKLIIKNFFGERKDRTIEIDPKVSLKVENDIIHLESSNKELAGQQASKLEALTRITSRDRRVFQDGIWIIKKEKGKHAKKH